MTTSSEGAAALPEAAGPATVRVWDIAVRLFHWSLVVTFLAAFVSGDHWERFHEQVGYAAAGLVGFRIFWGLVGSRHARFTSFVRGPAAVIGYLFDMLAGREKRYLGHNPAGGAMIIVLLLGVLGLAGTGYLLTLDRFHEAKWLEEVHEVMANGMLVLIALHVAGVIFVSVRHGENLVRAMITGRKRA